jgi:hypothetical protein
VGEEVQEGAEADAVAGVGIGAFEEFVEDFLSVGEGAFDVGVVGLGAIIASEVGGSMTPQIKPSRSTI